MRGHDDVGQDVPTLRALVRQAAERLATRHAGVVVGAVRGDLVEIRGAGRVGGAVEAAPDAGTLFEIGSVTKVFTSLALARRVAAGTVDLDEPVRQLLPAGVSVPSRAGEEITPRHLATHTSGLPRLPKGMLARALLPPTPPDPYADCTAESIYAGLGRATLRATPGERFRYSNLGAGLLGLALANRAGTDYATLVAEEICQPLGLADTGVGPETGTDRARLAQGHTRRGRPTPPWNLNALAGAGGLRSTAADLVTFLRAQLDPGTDVVGDAMRLSRQYERRLTARTWIHLGWLGLRLPAGASSAALLWHNGGTGGFRSWVGFIPSERAAVVVLSNTYRGIDGDAFDLLRTVAFGPDRNA